MPKGTVRRIRVLVVDDSASVRQTLTEVLESDPEIMVIGTAADPYVAARRIQEEVPDVITLDIEMPRMDGITFLRKIMAQRPLPVVMCTALADEGSTTLMQALEAGAVDVILKPRIDTKQFLIEARVQICDIIKAAASARMGRVSVPSAARAVPAKLTADAMLPPPVARPRTGAVTEPVICIGASTGGTESLRVVLEALPADAPAIVIVQHMPEGFTRAFARRLDSLCAVEVREAEDGDAVMRGRVLIAPGNKHLMLERTGSRYQVQVREGPLVTRHRPSVDVLFRSAARAAGANAVGILMTGMGDDGARGLGEMRQSGAMTVAQDEATSVVFGMPKEAIARGAAEKILPLDRMAAEIMRACSR